MDAMEEIIEQWRKEIPTLSLRGMEVFGRLGQAAILASDAVESSLSKLGLKMGEFDVLASLRRSGPPFQLNPTQLWQGMLLSSGAMTNRLDRLEIAGYIERFPDPNDRRATLVSLTEKGLKLINEAVVLHTQNEDECIQDFTVEEITSLNSLLSKLKRSIEKTKK
ncbi:MarR family transcriptional regulator [Leptospira bourretii]|uniref:MarR family transcriptional regulator n=2 Tax=Leptospira bourretii TaxID=2484962 RepID=A0A4R9IRA7_9LEPT|nr:MarR family transcriptional regulator [Leptospira bourretii]TGK94568.1 MarR family transcriptional regulator [Leptospira bourretii]TGL24925.1 MarR family transcriptional regulator [Leptospira bourretii]TGL37062.1 MarR family transcriptional regulator [Leptospira bourretii]